MEIQVNQHSISKVNIIHKTMLGHQEDMLNSFIFMTHKAAMWRGFLLYVRILIRFMFLHYKNEEANLPNWDRIHENLLKKMF